MAYQKVSGITNADSLVNALKSFVQNNSTEIVYAGNCGAGNLRPSFKNSKGYNFNFEFGEKWILTTITRGKPATEDILTNGMASPFTYIYSEHKCNIAVSNGFIYPMLNASFFTDGKLICMVLETTAGVYRHHAFGNLTPFGTFDGGEYAGGTAVPKGALSWATMVGLNVSIVSDSMVPFTNPFVTHWGQSASSSNNVRIPYYEGVNYRAHILRVGDDWLPTMTTNRYHYQNPPSNINIARFVSTFDYFSIFGESPNVYNGRVQLAPLVWNTIYPAAGNWSLQKVTTPVFHTDFVAYSSLDSFQVEEVINNEWVLFPLTTKIQTITEGAISLNYALAYKK